MTYQGVGETPWRRLAVIGLRYGVVMDTAGAGWFIDPTTRFSGRYFDGENWTDQVSDQGVLQIDHEWFSAIDTNNIDASGTSDLPDARPDTSRSTRFGYDAATPASPVATRCGGRNDRRQVQIPVAVDRRRSSRDAEPQGLAKQPV